MTTIAERNAVSLLISAENSQEVAERMADFVERFGRLPMLGELPLFYLAGLPDRVALFDMLRDQFIVEYENDRLRVIHFPPLP